MLVKTTEMSAATLIKYLQQTPQKWLEKNQGCLQNHDCLHHPILPDHDFPGHCLKFNKR